MAQLLAPVSPAEAPGVCGVAHLLKIASSEVRRLWQAALEAGDFGETARWVDAGQAIHRALIAVDDHRVG